MPNQQQNDFVPWLIKNFGKKFYLIGSNYIYPKEENNFCKNLLEQLGGEVVGEEYVPLGHSEFSSVINKFRSAQPNVIFSTVVGDSRRGACIGNIRPPVLTRRRCRWPA